MKKACENGIDVIRIFDALNDTRNLRQSIESTNRYGGWPEVALSYTTSPVHTFDYFIELAQELEGMGAKSICIKDMANLLLPYEAYNLVSALKKHIKAVSYTHLDVYKRQGQLLGILFWSSKTEGWQIEQKRNMRSGNGYAFCGGRRS